MPQRKKYGLPSLKTVVTKPTRAMMEKALDESGKHAIALLKKAGYQIINGKVVLALPEE